MGKIVDEVVEIIEMDGADFSIPYNKKGRYELSESATKLKVNPLGLPMLVKAESATNFNSSKSESARI